MDTIPRRDQLAARIASLPDATNPLLRALQWVDDDDEIARHNLARAIDRHLDSVDATAPVEVGR